jgi:hypothetical protein
LIGKENDIHDLFDPLGAFCYARFLPQNNATTDSLNTVAYGMPMQQIGTKTWPIILELAE